MSIKSIEEKFGGRYINELNPDVAALIAVAKTSRCWNPIITYAGRTPIHRRCGGCDSCVAMAALEALS